MNSFRQVVLLILTFTLSLSIYAQKQSPAEAVRSFYKFHNSRNGILSLHEIKLHKKFFTLKLFNLFLNEIKREEEYIRKNPSDKPHFGDGLPFKPLEECFLNDKFYANTFEFKEISSDAQMALVEARFFRPNQCGGELVDTYKIELLKIRNTWLINDWIYSDEAKLSDDLKRKDY